MAADLGLMRGAYMAATGGTEAAGFGKYSDRLYGGIAKVGEAVGKHIKKKSDEFNDAANEALAGAGEYSDADWNLRYDQVNDMKSDYILGNRKDRADIMRDFSKLKLEQDEAEKLRLKLGEAVITPDGTPNPDGFNKDFMGSEMGESFQTILKGKMQVTYDPITGGPGYMFSTNNSTDNFEIAKDYFLTTHNFRTDELDSVGLYDKKNKKGQKFKESIIAWYKANHANQDGELEESAAGTPGKSWEELDAMFSTEPKWHSLEETNRLIKQNSVDVNARKFITDSANQMRIKSSKILPGTNGAFPYEVQKANIKDNLIGMKGVNMASLGRDPMFVGSSRTWKKDMIEALAKSNYSELGIPLTEEEAKEMDETPDTPITPMDARIIVQNVMDDEDVYAEYLAEYFTKFEEQNWNKGSLARQSGAVDNVTPDSFQ